MLPLSASSPIYPFSRVGRTVAAGGANGVVRLWEVETGDHLGEITGSQNPVWSVAFSPSGDLLASGHVDGTILLRDVSGNAAWTRRACRRANRDLSEEEWKEHRLQADVPYLKTCSDLLSGEEQVMGGPS